MAKGIIGPNPTVDSINLDIETPEEDRVVGNSIQFRGTASMSDNDEAIFYWDLDDDGDFEIKDYPNWRMQDGRTETYYSVGQKTVHFSAKAKLGSNINVQTDTKTVSKTFTIDIANKPPQADFTISTANTHPGATIDFQSQSSDSDGSIDSYQWDFDDGGTAVGQSVSYSYANTGTYQVKHTVQDNDGKTDSLTKEVVIKSQPPQADFSVTPLNPKTGQLVSFSDQSSDPDASVKQYDWDFGDGTSSTKENPRHTYNDDGTYSVSLTVTDSDGLTDTETKQIDVDNRKPTADFTRSPSVPEEGESVTFQAIASDPDGTVSGYQWGFGDGNNGSGETVTHTYSSSGSYNVTLTVEDNDGGEATISKTVTVSKPRNLTNDGPRVYKQKTNSDAFFDPIADHFAGDRPGGYAFDEAVFDNDEGTIFYDEWWIKNESERDLQGIELTSNDIDPDIDFPLKITGDYNNQNSKRGEPRIQYALNPTNPDDLSEYSPTLNTGNTLQPDDWMKINVVAIVGKGEKSGHYYDVVPEIRFAATPT